MGKKSNMRTKVTKGGFIGKDPRGVWKLYIVDDTNQRSGFISGSWCLILNP